MLGRGRASRRRLEDALEAALIEQTEMAARREALEAERCDLITAANHQLRTPLTNILGYAEVLLEDETWDPPGAHRDIVERIHRNAERLHREINMIRLLSPVSSRSARDG